MRLLVVGNHGQVGNALLDPAPPYDAAVIALDRSALDVTEPAEVMARIAEVRPDVVVNASAYTAVDEAEADSEAAFAVNDTGVRNLAAACRSAGAALVHISTDYVFDGVKKEPYREDDPVDPINVYGCSKEAGERALRASLDRHAIVRTSWVFSARRQNFVRTMLRLGQDRDEIAVVADQTGCPTPAHDLADVIFRVAQRLHQDAAVAGTYHYCGRAPTSWHGFAEAVFDLAAPWTGRRPRLRAITSAERPTAARRPANSVLDCTKIAEVFGIAQRPWRDGLAAVVNALHGGRTIE